MDLVFLHGGGDKAESRQDTFGRFAAAALAGNAGHIALVIAEANEQDAHESWQAYSAIFTASGVLPEQLQPLYTSAAAPLTYDRVAQNAPSGLFVCGGVTPYYHQAVCADPGWVAYLQAAHIPYGGTSAGAAITAQQAILGGWQAERQGTTREILFVGAGEGLNPLTVRPGLGLAPFAVDVHASQMGTLTRLIHAVELGLVGEGWAIDENTMMVVNGRTPHIHGLGHCYHVTRAANGSVKVTIHTTTDSR